MPRRHTTGWDMLGFDADPTPGDPTRVLSVSRAYDGIAEDIERAYRLLNGRAIRSGEGAAMRELNEHLQGLPGKLRLATDSFRTVATAYSRYATTLGQAQDRLDEAIDRATDVHVTAAQQLPEPPAADATTTERAGADRRSREIEAARTAMSAAERLAAEAKSLREDGAGSGWGSRRVERELRDAADSAIPERDWWDKAVDFFDDVGEAIDEFMKEFPWLETALQIAVGILSIAFPVLGLILGAVMLLVQAWRMAATGEWDLTSLAVGVLAMASGGIVRGIAALGRLGPVANALSAAATRSGPMRAAVTRATASMRAAGGRASTATNAATTRVLGRRGASAVREAASEGGIEAGAEVAISLATGQPVTLSNVLSSAAEGAVTGGGGRGVADGLGRGGPDAGTSTGGPDPTPTVAPDSAASSGGSAPTPPAGPDPTRSADTGPSAATGRGAAGDPESTESGGSAPSSARPTTEGAEPVGPTSDAATGEPTGTRPPADPNTTSATPDPSPPSRDDQAQAGTGRADAGEANTPPGGGPDSTPRVDLDDPRRRTDIIDADDPRSPTRTRGFGPPTHPEPDTDYVVVDRAGAHRGVYHTDGSGRITDVTIQSGSFDPFDGAQRYPTNDPISGGTHERAGQIHYFRTPAAHAMGSSHLNPDLNQALLPETRYHVDGRFHFTTDPQGRVVRIEDDKVQVPAEAPRRSRFHTREVGHQGGSDYDGGHGASAETGGPNERINLAPMRSTLNQIQPGASFLDNYRAMEMEVARLARDPDTGSRLDLRIEHHYDSPTSTVPSRIDVHVTEDGQQWIPLSYDNGPTSGGANPTTPDPADDSGPTGTDSGRSGNGPARSESGTAPDRSPASGGSSGVGSNGPTRTGIGDPDEVPDDGSADGPSSDGDDGGPSDRESVPEAGAPISPDPADPTGSAAGPADPDAPAEQDRPADGDTTPTASDLVAELSSPDLNPIAPGNRPLGVLGDPDGRPGELLTRDADDLISHVGGRPIAEFTRELTEQRADHYRERRNNPYARNDIGEVVSVVVDRRTGRIHEATNEQPDVEISDPHRLLKERIEHRKQDPANHALPTNHAEVKAINELLRARNDPNLDSTVLADFLVDNYFPFKKAGLDPAPCCTNCTQIIGRRPGESGEGARSNPGWFDIDEETGNKKQRKGEIDAD
jgi:hypothetical protein